MAIGSHHTSALMPKIAGLGWNGGGGSWLSYLHLQGTYESKRAESYYKERSKWDGVEAKQKQEDQRFQYLRDTGLGAKSNKSGTDYNIISLEYTSSARGAELKNKVKNNAEVVAVHLMLMPGCPEPLAPVLPP